MLNIAILGLGEGRSTMSAALQSKNINLVKVCDVNEELCKARAKEFDFNNFTTDYQDLLDDKSIDIIAIYTPDHLHAEHVKKALLHDKHVVCTKPFIDDLAKASELMDISHRTGKKVFIGQSSRFSEPMKKQKKEFDKGIIGDLITVEAHYHADNRWFLKKEWSLLKSFKWLYGGLSHPVDFVRWYLPDIEEVMGYGMVSPNGKQAGFSAQR